MLGSDLVVGAGLDVVPLDKGLGPGQASSSPAPWVGEENMVTFIKKIVW